MAQQIVNIGTIANDGTGDTVRAAGTKINANFTELFGSIAGLLNLKGNTDCSTNPNYPTGIKGDSYYATVAGKIGGASGKSVDIGDVYICRVDNAGGTEAAVGTSWFVLEHNLAAMLPLSGGTLSGPLSVPDASYDASGWDGSNEVPTKNAVRDKIEAIIAGAGVAASTSEQLVGTDAAKLATPDSVAALWEQGTDVASAATVSLGEGGYFAITGTTTITDIDFATDKAGRKAWVKFAGILTLTNGANLILPTGANIVTAAGDTACFVSEGADAVRCVAYQRASGAALGAYTDAQARAALNIAPTTQAGTAYTAAPGDAGGYIQFTNAAPIAFTIPPASAVAFAIGTVITAEQNGAGVVTLTAGAGVTLRSRGTLAATAGQYAVAQVKKVATDIWTIIGDVA